MCERLVNGGSAKLESGVIPYADVEGLRRTYGSMSHGIIKLLNCSAQDGIVI